MPTFEEKIVGSHEFKTNEKTGGLEGPNGEFVYVGPDGGVVNRAIAADRQADQNKEQRRNRTSTRDLAYLAVKPVVGQFTAKEVVKDTGIVEARLAEGRL